MRTCRKALCAGLVGILAVPGSASALDSPVGGAIGSELSLSVVAPAVMTMTHATPGSTSSVVTVTSTQLSWTLSIRDTGATPGYMDRVSGSGPASLVHPLEWKLGSSGSYANLTSSPATVRTGSLVGTAQVDFRQWLGATEPAQVGDVYSLTVTYTVA